MSVNISLHFSMNRKSYETVLVSQFQKLINCDCILVKKS